MAKYSPVAPIHILQGLHHKGLLTDYLLLLAHDVLAHPHEYEVLMEDMNVAFGHHPFIIMDNGVIELGQPVTVGQLLWAADTVHASVVVSPDVLKDLTATKKLVMEQSSKIRAKYKMMLIPQGGDPGQVYDCIEWMHNKFPGNMQYWGIPRWMTNEFGSRLGIMQRINELGSNQWMHLLGMSEKRKDDLTCARMPDVIGIDSANPLVLGWAGNNIEHTPLHVPRNQYWEEARLNQQMCDNVSWMHNELRTR